MSAFPQNNGRAQKSQSKIAFGKKPFGYSAKDLLRELQKKTEQTSLSAHGIHLEMSFLRARSTVDPQ